MQNVEKLSQYGINETTKKGRISADKVTKTMP